MTTDYVTVFQSESPVETESIRALFEARKLPHVVVAGPADAYHAVLGAPRTQWIQVHPEAHEQALELLEELYGEDDDSAPQA